MGAYNIKTITYKNQTQVRYFKKPIKFGQKKVRSPERKNLERTEKAIELSIQQSMHRTKDTIWKIALSNDWEYFVTFTFNPNIVNSSNYEDCVYNMSSWLHNAKKRCSPDLKYLIVPEFHSDKKKFHFHALMSNLGNLSLVDSGYRKGGKFIYNIANYKLGFSTAIAIDKDADGQNKTCGYMLKYITKDLVNLSHGKKRYWYSIKNCSKPIEENFLIENDKISDYVECFENDKTYKKTIDMPFSSNELKLYSFDTSKGNH